MLAKTVAQLNGDELEEIGRRLACQLGEKVFHSRGNAPRPQGKPWLRIGRFMEKGWRVGHNARTGAILVKTEQGVMRVKCGKKHARGVAMVHGEVAVTQKRLSLGRGAERER